MHGHVQFRNATPLLRWPRRYAEAEEAAEEPAKPAPRASARGKGKKQAAAEQPAAEEPAAGGQGLRAKALSRGVCCSRQGAVAVSFASTVCCHACASSHTVMPSSDPIAEAEAAAPTGEPAKPAARARRGRKQQQEEPAPAVEAPAGKRVA